MRHSLLRLSTAAIIFASGAGTVLAAPSADLTVQMSGPSTTSISTATTYTVSVKNLGPSTADGVKVSVALPLTNTSPTVHILGNVSGCSVVANKLSCTVGTIKKNKTAIITYSYTAPVSTKVLQMTATATSNVADPVSGNSSASLVPNLVYPSRAITSATVTNSHCTGQNLSSYFECLLYPSSISSHETTLNADTTISFTEPGYTGNWSQNAAKTTLFFEYFDGAGKIAEFNGYAINGSNCFDGMTNFFPTSTYNSPYRVCIQ